MKWLGFIMALFRKTHIHIWKTTAINPFSCPLVQKCRCGESRRMEHRIGPVPEKLKGKGIGTAFQWAYDDATRTEYQDDWGSHY